MLLRLLVSGTVLCSEVSLVGWAKEQMNSRMSEGKNDGPDERMQEWWNGLRKEQIELRHFSKRTINWVTWRWPCPPSRDSLKNHPAASSSGRSSVCFLSYLFPSDDSYSFSSEPSAFRLSCRSSLKGSFAKAHREQIVCESCVALWILDQWW